MQTWDEEEEEEDKNENAKKKRKTHTIARKIIGASRYTNQKKCIIELPLKLWEKFAIRVCSMHISWSLRDSAVIAVTAYICFIFFFYFHGWWWQWRHWRSDCFYYIIINMQAAQTHACLTIMTYIYNVPYSILYIQYTSYS